MLIMKSSSFLSVDDSNVHRPDTRRDLNRDRNSDGFVSVFRCFGRSLTETVSGPKVEVAEESENASRLMNLESKSIVGPLRGGGGGSSSKVVFSNQRLLKTCSELLLGLCSCLSLFKVPRSGGKPGIFLKFVYFLSQLLRLRPLGYCAPRCCYSS